MERIVRTWTEADLLSVREVLRKSWEAAYGSFIPMSDILGYLEATYSIEALRRMTLDPEVHGFVGTHGQRVVGVMRVRDNRGEGRTYVSSIYVLPEEQGSGWGHTFMGEAARLALASGRDELWLGVMTQNLPALAWYRRHGFVTDHEEPFQMGATTVQHAIGHLPTGAFLAPPVARADEQANAR